MAGASAQEQTPSAQQIVTRSLKLNRQNIEAKKDYIFDKREVEFTLDKEGKTKETETKTYEVFQPCSGWFERLVAVNDKPISDRERGRKKTNSKSTAKTSQSARPKKTKKNVRSSTTSVIVLSSPNSQTISSTERKSGF